MLDHATLIDVADPTFNTLENTMEHAASKTQNQVQIQPIWTFRSSNVSDQTQKTPLVFSGELSPEFHRLVNSEQETTTIVILFSSRIQPHTPNSSI